MYKYVEIKERSTGALIERFNVTEKSDREIDKLIKDISIDLNKAEYIVADVDDDYEYDEEGFMISCCDDRLDPDIMLCPTCKEHC